MGCVYFMIPIVIGYNIMKVIIIQALSLKEFEFI